MSPDRSQAMPKTIRAVFENGLFRPTEPVDLPDACEVQIEILAQGPAGGAVAPDGSRRRSWREIRGSVEYPQCGEDAQAWVTRGRRESDEHREQQGGAKR
jgi:hypothetical protein